MCSQDPNHSLRANRRGSETPVFSQQLPRGFTKEWLGLQSRRHFLGNAGKALALAGAFSLLGRGGNLLAEANASYVPAVPAKAKRVIHLFMSGGPSQLDTWDPKPNLHRYFGQNLPESVLRPKLSAESAPARTQFSIAPSPFRFAQYGQSGHWVSELFPCTARVADELAILKSVYTDVIDHKSAVAEMTETLFPATEAPIDPLDPLLADLSGEPQSTWKLYGPDAKQPGTFAHQCLLARRAAERGIRFTRIFHGGWDLHLNLPQRMKTLAAEIDRPTFALIVDLRQRGLLDDTLVIWGGEFGRTVYSQSGLTRNSFGRDHHSRCFAMWMAGGGVKPGISIGETDDFSCNIVKNPIHVRDLRATIHHLLDRNESFASVPPARIVHELIT